ncbi:MAG: sigma-54-dependent Fis family transcriptional regulator [Anaeromyxobacter sp.]|nr:sigma-54-dependent Fis family transcriptional regulator [Anaeromyxobacter sp.]MBL0275269.1 sigma-54-dependent Fis family transcriptional regulator [Anaeromyxobacter sp.]
MDDQPELRTSTAAVLRRAGHLVEEAVDGVAAVERLQGESFDVVLTDLRMPDVDGMEVLRTARQLAPETEVIVMTAYGTIQSAVEAIRRGASDFLAKPFKDDELLLRVAKAVEKRRLVGEVSLFAGEFRRRHGFDHIVGRSAAMRDVLDRIRRVAATDATVLLTGESGTGKEVVARALHVTSRRGDKPFVPVNCAAITETLLESELFGHARGAFTGATRARRGLFEEASGGTLFIDEIGETSPGFQAKLLRALQDGEIRRVGESVSLQVDVRVIAATNQDLRRAIAERRFREDLFYRLNVVPVRIPPLRERRDDVPLLATHFLARFNARAGTSRTLSREALLKLADHPWPGNVRELENMIEQTAALSPQDEIRAEDVSLEEGGPLPPPGEAQEGEGRTLAAAVEEAERRAIEASLARQEGDLGRVARDLGVSATTLWRKMKRLGISSRGAGPA